MITYCVIGVAMLVIGVHLPKVTGDSRGNIVAECLRPVVLAIGLILSAGSALLYASERFFSFDSFPSITGSAGNSPQPITPTEGTAFVAFQLERWKFSGRWTFVQGQAVRAFRGHTNTYHVSIDPRSVPAVKQMILDAWRAEGAQVSFDAPTVNREFPLWFPRNKPGLISLQGRGPSFRGWIVLDPKTGDVFFADVD